MPYDLDSEEGRPRYIAPFETKDLRGENVNIERGRIQLNKKEDAIKHVRKLGQHLNCAFQGQEVAIVRIEHGAYVFAADVTREMKDVTISDLCVQAETDENGNVNICRDCFKGDRIKGRPVIILDGLVRTGKTMRAVRNLVMEHYTLDSYGEEIVLCTMCHVDMEDKPVVIKPDLAAFYVEDGHIYGYGLHYNQTGRQHRHLTRIPRLRMSA